MLRAPAAPSKWMTLTAACLGLGMLMIDTFVVNVAFPAIGRDFEASLSTAEWTVSGYVLAVGVLPVALGRVGDIFGQRRVYVSGLLTFVLASVLCGAACSKASNGCSTLASGADVGWTAGACQPRRASRICSMLSTRVAPSRIS